MTTADDLPAPHYAECECDNGTEYGNPIHDWNCQYVRCLLGECRCEQDALDLLESDRENYLASAEYERTDR